MTHLTHYLIRHDCIAELVDNGLLWNNHAKNRIGVTASGKMVLDSIISQLADALHTIAPHYENAS